MIFNLDFYLGTKIDGSYPPNQVHTQNQENVKPPQKIGLFLNSQIINILNLLNEIKVFESKIKISWINF
jgi:hypothetical protein